MQSRQTELETFKRSIDLSALAQQYGYVRDTKRSTRKTISMAHNNGDRILVSQKPDSGHWTYYSVIDETSRGSVIDFVQQQEHVNLGEARKILRQWTGSPALQSASNPPSKEIEFDRDAILHYLKRFKSASKSRYLISRGIEGAVFRDAQFSNQILSGYQDAVIFPHRDESGVCGYEVKKRDEKTNKSFTSFSKNGKKALWGSNAPATIRTLVFCESPIEALSYYQLYRNDLIVPFLLSPSGNWSSEVDALISKIVTKCLPHSPTVIAAFNHDQGGDRQTERLKALIESVADLPFTIHKPHIQGSDWNDMIQPTQQQALSTRDTHA